MVTVPLYDTLGPNAARYIVQKTEMRFVVASEQQLASLFKLKPECPSLEVCIKMSAVTNAEREEAQRLGLRVLSIDEAYKLGEEHPADPVLPKSTDLGAFSRAFTRFLTRICAYSNHQLYQRHHGRPQGRHAYPRKPDRKQLRRHVRVAHRGAPHQG